MTRSRLIPLAIVVVLAVGVGAYLAYDNVLRGDAVAPLALPSTSASPSGTAVTEPTAAGDAGTTTPPGGSSADGVAGTWIVVDGSEAGYRVREQLAGLPAESDAVGRTNGVTGSITLVDTDDGGAQLTTGTIEVDTTTITSDEGRRDGRLRTQGLETDRFQTATFSLTEPVGLPAEALAGSPVEVTLVGDLTLHGVTRQVEIPAQAQMADGRIQVAGALSFALTDFEMTAPNVGGFIISISDEGAVEFLLELERS